MPNVDPLGLEYEMIQQKAARPTLASSGAMQGFAKQVTDDVKAAEFEKLLMQGLRGYEAVKRQMVQSGEIDEGDVITIRGPEVAFWGTPENTLKLYQNLDAAVQKKAAAKKRATAMTQITAEPTSQGQARAAMVTGYQDEAKDFVGATKNDEAAAALTAKEGTDPDALDKITQIDFSQLKSSEKAMDFIGTFYPDVYKNKQVQDRIRMMFDKEKIALEAANRPPPPPRADTGNKLLDTAYTKWAREAGNMPSAAKMLTEFNGILANAGYKTGNSIFDVEFTDKGDIAGMGAGVKPFRNFLTDQQSAEAKSTVAAITMIVRNKFFGATLSPNEQASFEDVTQNRTITSEKSLIEGMKRVATFINETLKKAEGHDTSGAGLVEYLKKQGVATSDDLTSKSATSAADIKVIDDRLDAIKKRRSELKKKKGG